MPKTASDLLKSKLNQIMKSWEERAVREVAAARHQKSLALRDSLPVYLTQLTDALSRTIDRTEARVAADRVDSIRIGQRHGRERATMHYYTMDQLIIEYHILRQVIFDVMEEEITLSPAEREVIVSSIEQAVNDAATQFSDTLQDLQERLTHTLAHDLRNPITAAKMSTQLIMRHPEDPEHCMKTAARISGNLDRLDSMIRDLLDTSRIRAGQNLGLQLSECDLDLIVRQVADEFNFTHGDRFEVISSGPCLGYWSDSGLRRLIENLLTNAVKYGAADTPISISLGQTADTVTLCVHNAGTAIPPDEQAALFEQYHRAQTAQAKTGWGIGLTLVKGMAEAHQGTVSVESAEGSGTTFTVVLPKDRRAGREAA